ncbi:putative RNA-binding domain superfamily [Helianthus annuus]|uniref:RNA-binding domain superfamily n=1 Tax=Helianthus annuus TaxID=4232 RepID=A0A9K3IXP7_HELAN|nr:putative RNA-binding domain superfamily [Helianthus annuus]KAJ0569188.1 putative RNA-binding domain superfamily [Helianthus annuus]KAJ0583484.1 putative RNA-binding domain superfamily [Helianthus annuus]KAJ0746218.1 putative RNA-binding domain superfamily [Helianthus annuus]KAJ0749226.1 putative RNA-binding domain superfamily [Helianthus annuus]
MGNRFGFISFNNVRDVKELERELNGTKMGNSKLKVNVARFASENESLFGNSNAEKVHRSEELPGGVPKHYNINSQAVANRGRGLLFSELFSKENFPTAGEASKKATDGMVVEVPEKTLAFPDLSGKAAVGRCLDLVTLNNLNNLLSKDGIKEFSLSYMGGLFMTVKFYKEEDCNELVCNHAVWRQWFSSLDHWSGQSMTFERIAWLKVVGVLIHLAVDEVYNSIVGRFGKVLHGSQRSSEDCDLSVNCLGILLGDGVRIADHITLKWKDKLLKVWVEEEMADWIPDCLREEESSSDDVQSSNFVSTTGKRNRRLKGRRIREGAKLVIGTRCLRIVICMGKGKGRRCFWVRIKWRRISKLEGIPRGVQFFLVSMINTLWLEVLVGRRLLWVGLKSVGS